MWIYATFIVAISIKIVYLQTCSNFEDGIDRSGPWYAYVQTMLSTDSCCNLCNAEGTRCQSWVFVRAGGSYAPGCYLKQNIPSINETSTNKQYCTSGFKQTSLITSGRCAYPGGIFELGIDRPGYNYARLLSIDSHPACCAMCQLEGDKCRAWTFIRNGAVGKESGCLLKNQIPPISNVPCVACTSGTK
ncbi:unnamed protein product [Rotaria socialis]|uniref:Apple domain-containing protein n=1 Tax=Rotaria socialis TaxID=392032 RepID=A0A818PXN5_9BILA|nr:unnamed protein product [Rotaria socialis]CAF3415092.1 unnamed protein product [Rotaria socialis]CAF3461240.1 unnamed protein product [Rotaria socialis]CAF3466085.1 unnamed protein product [Rotaria socialis]CAF3628207.1 unnamed protein product [Rotaria socialis]